MVQDSMPYGRMWSLGFRVALKRGQALGRCLATPDVSRFKFFHSYPGIVGCEPAQVAVNWPFGDVYYVIPIYLGTSFSVAMNLP